MTSIAIEHDLDAELAHGPQQRALPNKEPVKRGGSLSTLLRVFGACAVLASLSLFLIEGWTDGNDLNRYFKLLAQTGLITAAGIFLSFVVKEVKGARVFFGLGLVSAVANFTILGALTYSIFQLDNALGDYPKMLQWQAVSLGEFLSLAVGSILLMSLLARFSFSIFARNTAGKLTLSFLVLNTLLLVPVRDALYVSALAAIALLVAIQVTLGIIKRRELLMTAEAKYALACLFLPGLIIICRALGLYAVDEIVLLTLFSLMYYALRSVGLMSERSNNTKLLAIIQYGLGVAMAFTVVGLIPNQALDFQIAVFSLSLLAITFDQARLNAKNTPILASSFISLSTTGLLILNVITACIHDSLLITALSLLSMIAAFVLSNMFIKIAPSLRTSQILALIGIVATSLLLLTNFVSMLNVGAWVLVGGAGISLIVIASLYERFGSTFKLSLHQQDA